jgi:hypothetical protein
MFVERSRLAGLTSHEDNRGNASLPVLEDMQTFWREWGPRIAKDVGRQGWVLFILDAHEKAQEMEMLLSRVIRNKPEWSTAGWSENEWGNVEETTAEALAWFDRNCPDPDKLPEWVAFVLSGIRGNLSVLKRMGRELRALQAQGYSTVVLETDGTRLQATKGADIVMRECA